MIYKLEKLEANGGCVLDLFILSLLVLFVHGELEKLILGAKGLGTAQWDRGLKFYIRDDDLEVVMVQGFSFMCS